MRQRSKSSALQRDINAVLRGTKRAATRSHATKSNARDEFIAAYRAIQDAFGQAEEVAARVYNAAQRSGGDRKAMAKMKTVANRMEKAIQDYSGDMDELLAALE